MAISYKSAATTACETADWKLTNLELHKLLYLAHMQHLGRTGDALVSINFQAWKYGPVIAPLYHLVKGFGKKPIRYNVFNVARNMDLPEHRRVVKIIDKFGGLDPGQLVEITHQSGGAWDLYYEPDFGNEIIPNEAILAEFNEAPF